MRKKLFKNHIKWGDHYYEVMISLFLGIWNYKKIKHLSCCFLSLFGCWPENLKGLLKFSPWWSYKVTDVQIKVSGCHISRQGDLQRGRKECCLMTNNHHCMHARTNRLKIFKKCESIITTFACYMDSNMYGALHHKTVSGGFFRKVWTDRSDQQKVTQMIWLLIGNHTVWPASH